MTRTGRIVLPALIMTLAACVPWTVRPIEDGKQQVSSAASLTGNPAEYVDSIWESRLLPAVIDGGVDARVLLDALKASPPEAQSRYARREGNGPAYFLVKGEGVVTAVDTRSRVGLAMVDIAPYDHHPDVSIQIGPVLRGTSLRDATGIVRFSDFVNQLQFADAGNELNDRVLKTVLASLEKQQLKGKTVSFAGTVAAAANADIPLAEIVPVKLTPEASR